MNKKKLLALLMALVMTLTLVPVTAFADVVESDPNAFPVGTEAELLNAVSASSDISSIILTNDINMTQYLPIKRSMTIDGSSNEYTLTFTQTDQRAIRIQASDITVTLKNLGVDNSNVSGTDGRGVQIDSDFSGVCLTISNCDIKTTHTAVKFCGGTNYTTFRMDNSSAAAGWAALEIYSNDSSFTIKDSTLSGLNDKGENEWNNYSTIVFDGDCLYNDNYSKYANDNNMIIENSTVYASSLSANKQKWLGMQYGAMRNSVTVDSSSQLIDLDHNDVATNLLLGWYGNYQNNGWSYYDNGANKVVVKKDDENYVVALSGGASITAPAAPEKDGSVFCGWMLDEDPDQIVEASDNIELPNVRGYAIISVSATWTTQDTIDYVAQIGTTQYPTVEDAIAAATDGQTVELLCDASMTGTTELTMDKSITLDLKGHTLAVERINLKKGGLNVTTTVAGGKVTCSSQAFNVYGSENDEANYTTLTIGEGVTVEGNYAVCLFPVNNTNKVSYGATININGTLNGSKGTLFVSGNLGDSVQSGANLAASTNIPVINIGSTAVITSSADQAIAMNGMAKVNVVDGAQVTGREAIGFKRGILNVTGGTFRATGETVANIEANNNGTEKTGAALSITSTYNYAGSIKADISGGSFRSDYGVAVLASQSVKNAQTISFTEGNPILSITGGKFSSEPDSGYVASGYKAASISETPYLFQVGKVAATAQTEGNPSTSESVTYTVGTVVMDSDNNTSIANSATTNMQVTINGTTESDTNAYTDVITDDANKTAVGAAALSQLVSDKVADIVAAAVEAAGADADDNMSINVVLVSDGGTTESTNNTVTKITYEVHPEAIVYKTVNESETAIGSYAIKNEELNGTFSFKLDVTALGLNAGDQVYVTHKHANGTSEILGPYSVQADTNNKKFITVSNVTQFSEFELTPAADGAVSFKGASLRRRVRTLNGVKTDDVVNTSTDIRFTYNWALPTGITNFVEDNSYFAWRLAGSETWKQVPITSFEGTTASIVINGVPKGYFGSDIETKIHLAFENNTYLEFQGESRSVNFVATSLANTTRTEANKKWVDYGKHLLGELDGGYSLYTYNENPNG